MNGRNTLYQAISRILSVVGLAIALLVTLAEAQYYLAHAYRPGVSPHLVGLGAAIVCVAVAQLLRRESG